MTWDRNSWGKQPPTGIVSSLRGDVLTEHDWHGTRTSRLSQSNFYETSE